MMNKMFKNLQFGAYKGGVNLSHLGIAIRNAAGEIVSYDKSKDEIVNVELLNFEADNMIFAMPVAIKDIAKGDVVLHNNKPCFVVNVEGGVKVVDVSAGERKEIMPTKSMFGFDFVTKLITLIDFSGIQASAEQPFGNLLPFMLMSGNGSMKDMMLPMMLMNQGQTNFDMSNPLVLMALMGGSESKDFFPMLMLMNQFPMATKMVEKSQK